MLRNLASTAKDDTNNITVTFVKDAFKTPNPSRRDVLAIFLYQILSQKPSLFCRVESYYRFCCNQGIWTERALQTFARSVLQGAREFKLLLLIDDLAEWISSLQPVLHLLARINTSSKLLYQIIFTSQMQELSELPSTTLVIKMGHDDPETWNRFVQNKVADVCKWSVYSNLEKNVHDQIKCLSGDYLTVVLYLEQVSRLRVISTPAAIKQRLSDLPREKEKVYRDHVNRLAKTDHKLLEWSGHALSWIAHAFRPLTIQELSVAVAISQDGQKLSKDSVRDNIPMKMWEDLDRHLGLFVQRHDQKVLLFHQTTKEFLLSCGSLGGQGKENELNLLSHAKLAGLCLDYMSAVFSTPPIVGDSSTPLEQPQDPPTDDIVDALLDYAAEY